MLHSNSGQVHVSTPSPGGRGGVPASRLHPCSVWRATSYTPSMAHSSWHKPLGWAIGSSGALPMGNLSLQSGPAPVTLCALDYLSDAGPGTSCREARELLSLHQGTIPLHEMEDSECVCVCGGGGSSLTLTTCLG